MYFHNTDVPNNIPIYTPINRTAWNAKTPSIAWKFWDQVMASNCSIAQSRKVVISLVIQIHKVVHLHDLSSASISITYPTSPSPVLTFIVVLQEEFAEK